MQCLGMRKAALAVCAALALVLPACENGGNFTFLGYTTAPNYRCDIHTVRVKVFKNKTYRQGLEFQLTQAVIDEIGRFTPFRIVQGDAPADTEVTGTIMTFTKGLLNVDNVNEERDVETTLAVEFVWRDLRTGEILSKPPRRPFETIPEGPPLVANPNAPKPLEEAPLPTPIGTPGVPSVPIIGTPVIPGTAVLTNNGILITTTAHYIPELGQSIATAQQTNINKIAREIRQLMENPW
jgi:hypothetical protein